jgi:hypothetical protein
VGDLSHDDGRAPSDQQEQRSGDAEIDGPIEPVSDLLVLENAKQVDVPLV